MQNGMSALPLKADIIRLSRKVTVVRLSPQARIVTLFSIAHSAFATRVLQRLIQRVVGGTPNGVDVAGPSPTIRRTASVSFAPSQCTCLP